jgi:hypothetical protein
MKNKMKLIIKQRLREIEDRRIEILMKIAYINDDYNERISQLNTEYAQLHEEYYQLQLELIRKKSLKSSVI